MDYDIPMKSWLIQGFLEQIGVILDRVTVMILLI